MPPLHSRRSPALAVALALTACSREPVQPRLESAPAARNDAGHAIAPTAATPPPPSHPATSTAPALSAGNADAPGDDACAPESRIAAGSGWNVIGFHPGPSLRDVVAVDRRRLAATTRGRVCTSDDGGAHWTERLASTEPRGAISLRSLDRDKLWLAVVLGPASGENPANVSAAYLSRDGGAERWDRIALPAAGHGLRAVTTDGLGRIYAATDVRVFESADGGANWSSGHALPGRETREFDACGPTLLARARVDESDWFYQRSFDRGASWRPFRMGAIGVEGNAAVVRCITAHGGIEAGHPPLPMHWTWDGGLTWSPAQYDATAQRAAHAAAEHATADTEETPRCMAGPERRLIACADPGRLRLMERTGARALEIPGPSTCSRVRQPDSKHTMAFGDGCGVFVSTDRGGLWRMLTQVVSGRATGAYAEGRGGFIDARTAWRLDGGIWWTFDGGENWRPFFSIGERALERGVFVSALRGVFATNTGWVAATRDGGRTWTYVLRGEVERLASARRTVVVTTTQQMRVSPDGGVTWLTAGAPAPQGALDPTVEVVGGVRSIALAPGVRVVQREDRVSLESQGGEPIEVAQGLPRGYHLLAAHAGNSGVDRILLDGGVVLARGRVASTARPRLLARNRTHRGGGVRHRAPRHHRG